MKIQTFDFSEYPVRVVELGGQPWFVAADVCRVLDLGNTAESLRSLDEDEKGISSADTLGGKQRVLIISESGLYSLIFRSRKENARAFRKWVTSEVLPAIRVKGEYSLPGSETFSSALPRVEVAEIVLDTLRRLHGGSVPLNRAQVIFTGAKVYQSLTAQFADDEAVAVLPASCGPDDFQDVSRLLEAMVAAPAGKRWSSAELREDSLRLGVFQGWLNAQTVHSPSVSSRFGKLMISAAGSRCGEWMLRNFGQGRDRIFYLEPVSEVGASQLEEVKL